MRCDLINCIQYFIIIPMNIGNTICVYCYLFCQLYLKMTRNSTQSIFDIPNQFKTDKSFQFQSLIFNIELLFIKKNKNLQITQRAKRNLYCILTSWKVKHWIIYSATKIAFNISFVALIWTLINHIAFIIIIFYLYRIIQLHIFYFWIHSGIIYLLRLFFTGYAFKIGLLLFSYCFIIKMRVEEKR